MKVFIANFGRENYEWPECRRRGTVATMNEINAQPLWVAGDKEGYIVSRIRGKTAAGLTPTRSVAARWYNLMTIISETSDDIWIHRDGEKLRWTKSLNQNAFFMPKTEPVYPHREVIVCHKPCEPWSDSSQNGTPLLWRGLHPKARDFLSTEATLQQLSEDYADYAIALVHGSHLEKWHSHQIWRTKSERAASKFSEVRSYSRIEKVAYRLAEERMANTAIKTAERANGQEISRILKNKEVKFTDRVELEKYIVQLIDLQDSLCALTGLPLELDEKEGDKRFFCSLDRIDSGRQYEDGNLQVVCRFANRWKGADDNNDFVSLIQVIRSTRFCGQRNSTTSESRQDL